MQRVHREQEYHMCWIPERNGVFTAKSLQGAYQLFFSSISMEAHMKS